MVLCKDRPENPQDDKFTLKVHNGNPSDHENSEADDRDLDRYSLIEQSAVRRNNPKLLVCITMYNEPPKQLVESLIGVYRAYYELVEIDKNNLNKVQVVIVIDGYENLSQEDLMVYEKAGIYNAFSTSQYKYAELSPDKTSYDVKFKGMVYSIENDQN